MHPGTVRNGCLPPLLLITNQCIRQERRRVYSALAPALLPVSPDRMAIARPRCPAALATARGASSTAYRALAWSGQTGAPAPVSEFRRKTRAGRPAAVRLQESLLDLFLATDAVLGPRHRFQPLLLHFFLAVRA